MTTIKALTTAQLKVGDVLRRTADHLGRPDDALTITAIRRTKGWPLQFSLDHTATGRSYHRNWETAKALSAQNYRHVERNGVTVGHFFVKYW